MTDMLDGLIEKLGQAGIPCRKSFYPGKLPIISGITVVAHRKQVKNGLEQCAITVAVPSEIGGLACEEKAWQIYGVLTQLGANCTLESCRFDGKSDCFLQELTVWWEVNTDIPVEVMRNGFALPQVIYFRTQVIFYEDAENPGLYRHGNWEFEIRQRETAPEQVDTVPFTLAVTSGGSGSETLTGCRWLDVRTERTPEGLLLIRKGIASGRTVE